MTKQKVDELVRWDGNSELGTDRKITPIWPAGTCKITTFEKHVFIVDFLSRNPEKLFLRKTWKNKKYNPRLEHIQRWETFDNSERR